MTKAGTAALAGLLVVALGLGAFLLARAWPELFPDVERLAVDPACDLRSGSCARDLPGGGRLSFAITPQDLPLMEPLTLEVRLSGTAVDGVVVDIAGVNMDMGINRTRLEHGADGVWIGTTILPVCTERRMQWETQVWLERDGGILAVPHRFETRR